ncbi:hypothetical protein AVEN_147968-1 [Araneus ventricosus]|uniref:Uncharacterized protein n=1 Tax=Araneus ventricosus TaxID=182803 RepID=A0A4Y2H3N5_ARAVE|nr:hypothetical protein AVEN_147968-1 [Araneus ventricosus]
MTVSVKLHAKRRYINLYVRPGSGASFPTLHHLEYCWNSERLVAVLTSSEQPKFLNLQQGTNISLGCDFQTCKVFCGIKPLKQNKTPHPYFASSWASSAEISIIYQSRYQKKKSVTILTD